MPAAQPETEPEELKQEIEIQNPEPVKEGVAIDDQDDGDDFFCPDLDDDDQTKEP